MEGEDGIQHQRRDEAALALEHEAGLLRLAVAEGAANTASAASASEAASRRRVLVWFTPADSLESERRNGITGMGSRF